MERKFWFALICATAFIGQTIQAQEKTDWHFVGNGSLYFSWGYNKEWYTPSTVHVSQPSLGNDYKMVHVSAHDHPGWDDGLFSKALSIPQYNYRLGYFFNKKQDLAIEINFDHTKYIIADNQDIKIKGKFEGQEVNTTKHWSASDGSFYYLNNGANFLLFNLVKRFRLVQPQAPQGIKLDLLAKAGIGPVIPHVENSFWGNKNNPDFQIGGWNTGVETAFRLTGFRYIYLEFAQKFDYARYSHLHIYNGSAKQAFGTYELILNLGITLPTGKHNKEFTKVTPAVDTRSN